MSALVNPGSAGASARLHQQLAEPQRSGMGAAKPTVDLDAPALPQAHSSSLYPKPRSVTM